MNRHLGGKMEEELELSVSAAVAALKELAPRLEQDVSEVTNNYALLESQYKTKAASFSNELNQLETRLLEARKSLQFEREKGLSLQAEFEKVKNAKKQQDAALEEHFAEIRSRIQSVSLGDFEALERRSEQMRDEVDYLSSKLSLYCSCSRIRWDYESQQSVSGQALTRTGVKAFAFPLAPGQNRPSFDQVNKLWELLD